MQQSALHWLQRFNLFSQPAFFYRDHPFVEQLVFGKHQVIEVKGIAGNKLVLHCII